MRTLLVISVGYCVDDICLLFMIISFALGLGRYLVMFIYVMIVLLMFMRLYSCKDEIGWIAVSLLKSWIEMVN